MSAATPFPLLLFAAGLGANPLEYTSIIEDLVSHGYVVAGVVSTYLAGFTVGRDGRAVMGRDPFRRPGEAAPTDSAIRQRYLDATSTTSLDLLVTLRRLSHATPNSEERTLARHIDFGRVGALGHSIGGAGAVQAARLDPRVRAVFNIDGSPVWNDSLGDLGKPHMIVSAATTRAGYGPALRTAKPGFQLRMAGTDHFFATDERLMPFSSERGVEGAPNPTDPRRALRITATYAEAFFDAYLKGLDRPLVSDRSSPFGEITIEYPRAKAPP